MFSHSLDNCAHKSQSDSSDVASYCMKKNSMCISHDDWQGEGVVCSHFKCYVGSRANTIWIAPPCVLDAGSALRGLIFINKDENMMFATSIWLDCTSNRCSNSMNEYGKLNKPISRHTMSSTGGKEASVSGMIPGGISIWT